MKIIKNGIIPFKKFTTFNLFGILFVRRGVHIDASTLNRQSIRTVQMKEMLYVPFCLWYALEWIVRLFMKGNARRNISFEREAYGNRNNMRYIESRGCFAWMNYLKSATTLSVTSQPLTWSAVESEAKSIEVASVDEWNVTVS